MTEQDMQILADKLDRAKELRYKISKLSRFISYFEDDDATLQLSRDFDSYSLPHNAEVKKLILDDLRQQIQTLEMELDEL